MKKIVLLSFCLLSAIASNAQISKGSYLLGTSFGSINVGGSKSTSTYSNTPTVYESSGNSFNIQVNPYVGYFVSDGLAIGGQVYLGYYSSSSDSSNSSSTTTTTNDYKNPSVSVGPMIRYHFTKDKKWSPYAQADASFGISPYKSESSSSSGSSSTTDATSKGSWSAGARFGMEYFISSYVGLNLYLGFSYGQSKTEYDYSPSTGTGYTYTNDYKSWSIPVGVGLQVHLPSKSSKD